MAKPAPAKKSPAKQTPAKKTTGSKTPAKKTTGAAARSVNDRPAPPKKAITPAPSATRPKPAAPPKPTKPAPKPVRPAKLDAAALEAIRGKLEKEKADLERQLGELQSSFDLSQSDMSGDAGLNEDFADAGTATFDRERDLSIRNNVLDLIDQVTRALRRIDEGTYGTCERCGQPIDAARIKAFPRVLMCLDCKRREERIR
ncbi:MAG: TraR/DksA C4-type zinc finger protein [Actinomycetota bacterium]|nr:TraR/DksA C4-type zinc finger protein [Actinomycetota bacterium]